MTDPSDELLYEGLTVDLGFQGKGPSFGDLFEICGFDNPRFPPTGTFEFSALEDLQFSQVDDYFGVQATSDDGDDVVVWLFPLVDGEIVHHHPGPFDGLRLQYNVLRNPKSRFDHFLLCVERMMACLPVNVQNQPAEGDAMSFSRLSVRLTADFESVRAYWQAEGIELGSSDALRVDF